MDARAPLRTRIHDIVFGHRTFSGKAFDVALLVAILLSVAAVVFESVKPIRERHGPLLQTLEWTFTIAFLLEYFLRIYCARSRVGYVRSFFGLIDLLALLPGFVSLIIPGAQSLLVVRVLRVLRVFRVLKLVRFYGQADLLLSAVLRSLPKITVFLGAVLTVVIIMGSTMYVVEGPAHGFDNIPAGMYWAVVTVTTVGFGDITPGTPLGRFVASLLMMLGYAILAVPTGIVSSELLRGDVAHPPPVPSPANDGTPTEDLGTCPSCLAGGHYQTARFCFSCGRPLPEEEI